MGGKKKKREIITLDAIVLFNFSSGCFRLVFLGVVPYRHVRSRLSKPLGHCETNTCCGSRDDGRFTFQGEKVQDAVGIGGSCLEVGKLAIFDVCHFCLARDFLERYGYMVTV